jgi:hypothetical protein
LRPVAMLWIAWVIGGMAVHSPEMHRVISGE